MARDSTESRFLEVLERFGGAQSVQLVGELWERSESRALLEGFLRELFQADYPLGADIVKVNRAQPHGGDGNGSCEGQAPPKPERTLSFGLVFFLCRPESLRLRRTSRELREILRDVRERMPAGGAVIGVIMRINGQQMEVMCEDGAGDCQADVSALLAILHSVFPQKSRERLCSEVRASVLIPGQEETRREIQRLACEALTSADEWRKQNPKMKSCCFSWKRRRRWKDHMEKEFIQEGTPLTVLQYPNGDCAETTNA